MGAKGALTVDADARRRLWLAYQVILDCARRAEGKTDDDANLWPESWSAPVAGRRLSTRRTEEEIR